MHYSESMIQRVLKNIGSCTLGMYLTHSVIILALEKFYKLEGPMVHRVLIYISVVIISYLLTEALRRIPFLRRAVS